MKWSDILAFWSTVLMGTSECSNVINTEQFLSCGTFNEETQIFSVDHTQLQGFVALLCENHGLQMIVRMLAQIVREHMRLQTPLRMRVCHDATDDLWSKICATLFRNHWTLNLRSVLRFKNSPVGLEYCGHSDSGSFSLTGKYLTHVQEVMYSMPNTAASAALFQEFSVIVFQILWTFSVLSKLGLYLMPPEGDPDGIFDSIVIQRLRVEHYAKENASNNCYFVKENNFANTDGVFSVPIRNVFVTVRYEQQKTPCFGHSCYLDKDNLPIDVKNLCNVNESTVLAKESDIQTDQYLCLLTGALKRYIFNRCVNGNVQQVAPLDEKFMVLYRSLHAIQHAMQQNKNGVDAFFDSPFARIFWKTFRVGEKQQIVQTLENPQSGFSILYMPCPVQSQLLVSFLPQTQQVQQEAPHPSRMDWCGFQNIHNNCFLNSVLFMLMCPVGLNNSFANAISYYAKQPDPSKEDFDYIKAINCRITDREQFERARRLIAQVFGLALYKSFVLSNYSNCTIETVYKINAEIVPYCKKLLPLLDMWSLAKRGSCLTNAHGEFQDLDECLLLICTLFQFEQCCVSTVQFAEEIRSLSFAEAEEKKLTISHVEEVSKEEKQNPLRLQVRSHLQPPLIRLSSDWVQQADKDTQVVDFQALCDASLFEYSMSPAPLTREQAAELERDKTAPEPPRATRYYGKRHLWSREKQMMIVHLPRRNALESILENRVTFPADEHLHIGGQSMRIVSLVLWSNSHYTSLVKDKGKWWHVNDMDSPGRRARDCGETLAAAIDIINHFRKLVTAVACVADEVPQGTNINTDRFFCCEVEKLYMEDDSMKDKAIIIRKDTERFSSVAAALTQFEFEVTSLPNCFLFGHDNPNSDFYFRDVWYDISKPFPQQKVEFSLVLAHGIRPGFAPSSNKLLFDICCIDVNAEEERIQRSSTLFNSQVLQQIRDRAEQTYMSLITTNQNSFIDDNFVNMSLDIMQMNHLRLNPRQYIAKCGVQNLYFDWYNDDGTIQQFSAHCWKFSTYFYHLLCKNIERVSPFTWRKSDSKPFRMLFADEIIIPINDERNKHWSLVRVQPQFRRISYYDSLANNGVEHCVKIGHYFMSVQQTMGIGGLNNAGDDWTMRNVYSQPLQTDTESSGLFLLYFCNQIFLGNGDGLELETEPFNKETLAELRKVFMKQLEHVGNLEPL